jgi:hypothetical protein
LRICQTFHRIGLGIHGRLDLAVSTIIQQEELDGRIETKTDLSFAAPSHIFLCELRSLTVHVLHARIAAPYCATSNKDLFSSLADTFRITRKLSTFSLKFPDDGWTVSDKNLPTVLSSDLARLVAALPETVVNLELDTAGIDVAPSQDDIQQNTNHLCYQLSKLVPRLANLRLRVGHLCESMLPSGSPVRPCPCDEDCDCCSGGGKLMCDAVRSWNLQRLNIWIPIGETEHDESFNRATQLLIKLSHTHGSITTIIRQRDIPANNVRIPIYPVQQRLFAWTVESNCPTILRGTLDVHGMLVPRSPFKAPHDCAEHQALTNSPIRKFFLGSEGTPASFFSYVAEWLLEDQSRWAQDGHRGCRYPAAEGDLKDKPFWKDSHGPPLVGAHLTALERGAGQFACLFPDCRMRCETLHQLRGHNLYAHPEQPHVDIYLGAKPCPSVGCDRIGLRGFHRDEDLEKHLMGHHLQSCSGDDYLYE